MIYKAIDIKCPNCGKLAKFEEPFEFLSEKELSSYAKDETKVKHKWGGWIVIERFPSQIKWTPPSGAGNYLKSGADKCTGGYSLRTNGLIQCSHCYLNKKHKLNWPIDSYWQWEIRGKLLWAWDKEHAEIIFEFIKGVIRVSRKCYSLKYIPSHFLSAKVRKLVIQKMENSLNESL